ncbi:four-carbon acid sugar kinase family protein [Arsenicibacter rosenii]|uniref:Four-carbon acid sugar kinase N-terminal domain-containing protein n=1 Tax=Arsenicibacter rosenii TaxID=1750698 RepID=A0A1S2VJ05_9BACT|nr:four-carbon acid sugar kinase family protein [Arsenicibacter rosenii]OIN58693.1 hypothetical protein BLX24_14115 [Arsenicibacter rosenii]
MIAVIADDLTGAAELAGIGMTYGLRVELAMTANPASTADLLVVSTDARSVAEPEAVAQMTAATQAIKALKPSLLYKKMDSVMRGHVLAEVFAQMEVTGRPNALLVSANPALGRTLTDGIYYINGVPIAETHFAQDPEFPVWHAHVLTRLRADRTKVFVRPTGSLLPERGIAIGEAASVSDLAVWAQAVGPEVFLGGAAGFFTALLEAHGLRKPAGPEPSYSPKTALFVCGTAFGKSVALVKEAADKGYVVSYMPVPLMRAGTYTEAGLKVWTSLVAANLLLQEPVIMAIRPNETETFDALHLRQCMALAVAQVLDKAPVPELIIEGGSTASAILRQLGIQRLAPVQELGPGVIRMQAIERPALHITMKPGSYAWPETLWTF